MVGRRNQRNRKEEVELNLAAMLDMAFQLLTFFILTFKPAPVEGDIALRLPPPQPFGAPPGVAQPGDHPDSKELPQDLRTLVLSLSPDQSGQVRSMAIGDTPVSMSQLDGQLKRIFGAEGAGFDQVIIQAGPGLRYDALMNVVDVCSRQNLPGGAKLKKLSFVEMPGSF